MKAFVVAHMNLPFLNAMPNSRVGVGSTNSIDVPGNRGFNRWEWKWSMDVMMKGTIRLKERPEKLNEDLVRDFVVAGHGDLEKVKAMLAETPTLVNAVWDWGGGDWESALGGAAHVGRRDIATFLIEQGAHGIPLIRHAEMGGDESAHLLAFLQQCRDEMHSENNS